MDLRLLLAVLLVMLAGVVACVFGADDCRCCDADAPTCAVVEPSA